MTSRHSNADKGQHLNYPCDDFDDFCRIANAPSLKTTSRQLSYSGRGSPSRHSQSIDSNGYSSQEELNKISPDRTAGPNMEGNNSHPQGKPLLTRRDLHNDPMRTRSRSVRERRTPRSQDASLVTREASLRAAASVARRLPKPSSLDGQDTAEGSATCAMEAATPPSRFVRVRSFKRTTRGVVSQGDSLREDGIASTPASPMHHRLLHNQSVLAASVGEEDLLRRAIATATTSGNLPPVAAGLRVSPELLLTQKQDSLDDMSAQIGERAHFLEIQVLGAPGVGKSTLCQQFLTSEYLGARAESMPDDSHVKFLTVEVDGGEYNLNFLDTSVDLLEDKSKSVEVLDNADAYLIIYAIDDRGSFEYTKRILNNLFGETKRTAAMILVANKSDLVRSREISTDDGKNLAAVYNSKFLEISTALNHRVDDLLVGVISQIRYQHRKVEKEKSKLTQRHRGPLRSSLRLKAPRQILSRFIKKHFNRSCDDVTLDSN